jgi:tRNA wybutosine-synthesizing protein 2
MSDLSGERPLVLAVPKERAGALLHRLQPLRIVDRSLKISKRGDWVHIPLLSEPPFDLSPFAARWDSDPGLPRRIQTGDPRAQLEGLLRAAGIPQTFAPRRWKRIGDVVILRLSPEARVHATALGEIYGSVLRVRTVFEDRSGIHGPLRTPDVRVLWGNGTETVHIEAGVRYSLDVARVMFSPGNLGERVGIADRIRQGSVVVDLFAGIGYFALPIAVRRKNVCVHACELNPVSFSYLVRNIGLNRVSNVFPLLGDCRRVAPRGVADWVLMGHFDAREYLDVAFSSLRGKGTILYHELCPKEQYPDAMTRRLAAAARANWRDVVTIRTRVVKSFAPGILHAVAELHVRPQART